MRLLAQINNPSFANSSEATKCEAMAERLSSGFFKFGGKNCSKTVHPGEDFNKCRKRPEAS